MKKFHATSLALTKFQLNNMISSDVNSRYYVTSKFITLSFVMRKSNGGIIAKILVEYSFVNKKGIQKKVKFPMDKKSYEVYQDERISSAWRDKMMQLEYKDYCDERNYKKRFLSLPLNDYYLFEDLRDDNLEKLNKDVQRQYLRFLISKLTSSQRKVIYKIYYEAKKPGEVAKELNITVYAVSMLNKRAILSLKRLNNEKNYKDFLNTR